MLATILSILKTVLPVALKLVSAYYTAKAEKQAKADKKQAAFKSAKKAQVAHELLQRKNTDEANKLADRVRRTNSVLDASDELRNS